MENRTSTKLDKSKENVRAMFDDIAHNYDFLNHFLSINIDKIWRKKVIKIAKKLQHDTILDLATGTGDLAIELYKLKPKEIIGADISPKMLEIAKQKANKLNMNIKFVEADATNLEFPENHFDIVTCAFGVRNFENLSAGLSEINKVLKKGGTTIILEFSKIENKLLKRGFELYFNKILPFFGKIFSKNNKAYKYLAESVNEFPYGIVFGNELKKTNFVVQNIQKLSGGIATIYIAKKLK